jgi:hypothetical protein
LILRRFPINCGSCHLCRRRSIDQCTISFLLRQMSKSLCAALSRSWLEMGRQGAQSKENADPPPLFPQLVGRIRLDEPAVGWKESTRSWLGIIPLNEPYSMAYANAGNVWLPADCGGATSLESYLTLRTPVARSRAPAHSECAKLRAQLDPG